MQHDEYTIANALKDEGYNTYHVGKWHLGTNEHYPEHFGFNVNIGGCDWGHPKDGYFSPYHIETLPEGPDGEYLTDRITDEAIKLIRNNGDKPFYLNLWHYTVHIPIQAPESYVNYFKEKAKKLKLDQRDPLVEGEHFPTEHKKNETVKRRIFQSDCVYAAMIKNLDDNMGRLVKELKDEGIYDDTIIIFTSDNGGLSTSEGSPTCNLPATEGKGWLKEGGMRIPLSFTYGKKVEKGMHTQIPATTPDLYPTILDLIGGKMHPEQHVDGISLAPALRGESMEDRPIFWHYPHYGNQGGTPGSAVRYGKWKLILFYEDLHKELYNLEEDISEVHEVSKEYPEIADRLLGMLDEWLINVGAKFPTRNENR